MKAKREFYMHGNDRQFAEEHLISTMTGEPMPKKWQRFMELTPEEKARWDASLRLDAEYRVAEAQGFPNGIPGGRMRGSGLYTITQMEEEHERELQKKRMEEERARYEQSFIPRKTEIQSNANAMYGNINPANQLWQNPYNTQTNDLTTGISAFSGLQTEKEPAFNVNQAIHKLADRVRSMWESGEEQAKMIPTKLELYEVLSPYGMTYKEIKGIYPQTAQNQEQVDMSNMTDEDKRRIREHAKAEINQIIENKPAGQDITDYEMYEVLSKYGVKYKDWRRIRLAIEEILKTSPTPRRYFAPHAVDTGVGTIFANSDYVAQNKELKKNISEEGAVSQAIPYSNDSWAEETCKALEDFIGTVNTVGDNIEGNLEIIDYLTNLWSDNIYLKGLGIAVGKVLRVWNGYQCFRNVYNTREQEIGHLVQTGEYTREEAEIETLKYLPQWLTMELVSMGLGMYIDDKVKERFFFRKDNKTILWEDYGA